MSPRTALCCIGVVATGFFWLAGNLRANDLGIVQGYGPRAVEPCDPFAEELDAVAAAGTCMKFGERVRVDLGTQMHAPAGRAYGAAPAAVRVEEQDPRPAGQLDLPRRLDSLVTRRHLRIPSPAAATGTIDPASAR